MGSVFEAQTADVVDDLPFPIGQPGRWAKMPLRVGAEEAGTGSEKLVVEPVERQVNPFNFAVFRLLKRFKLLGSDTFIPGDGGSFVPEGGDGEQGPAELLGAAGLCSVGLPDAGGRPLFGGMAAETMPDVTQARRRLLWTVSRFSPI